MLLMPSIAANAEDTGWATFDDGPAAVSSPSASAGRGDAAAESPAEMEGPASGNFRWHSVAALTPAGPLFGHRPQHADLLQPNVKRGIMLFML